MTPPLVLLPPSKGKAAGGDGPAYGRTAGDGPLGAARVELLAAVRSVAGELGDAEVARICGVPRGAAGEARDVLRGLDAAPTLPARHRYTGIVHRNAGLAEADPADLVADVRIVSPLLGLASLDDAVPAYRLELAARLAGLGGLARWWRARLRTHLGDLAAGRRVWDLLPAEHARVWDRTVRDELEVISVCFVRPDGRAANAARAKVCKGRIAAALLAEPSYGPRGLAREVDPGPGWSLRAEGQVVTAEYTDDRRR